VKKPGDDGFVWMTEHAALANRDHCAGGADGFEESLARRCIRPVVGHFEQVRAKLIS
jgi:hypothetical protein